MRKFFLVSIVCLLLTGTLWAQIDVGLVQKGIEERAGQIEQVNEDLADSAPDFIALREQVRDLKRASELQTLPARELLETLKSDLDKLGPLPEEGEPPESEEVIAERTRLNEEISELTGIILQADLNIAAADRLLSEISDRRRESFSSKLLSRGPSILEGDAWGSAIETFRGGMSRLSRMFEDWAETRTDIGFGSNSMWTLGIAILIALALFGPLRSAINRSIDKRTEGLEPLRSRKVLVAAARSLAVVVPGIVGGYLVFEVLRSQDFVSSDGEPIAIAIWLAFVSVLLADGATVGILSPRRPDWRVATVPQDRIFTIRLLLITGTLILGVELILLQGAELLGRSIELDLIQKGIFTWALSILLFVLCSPSLWIPDEQRSEAENGSNKTIRRLLFVGRGIAVFSVLANIMGFAVLGHFAVTRTYYLAGLFAVIWLLRSLLREGVRLFDENFTSAQKTEEDGEKLVYFWVGTAIDTIAILAFIPPAALILGAEASDLRDLIVDAFFGFNIGSVRISFAEFLGALALFLGLLYVTRLIQRTAESRLFPKSRIDVGVQNSLKTLIGYVGLVIAFAVAVGTLGFDLSNLAIIAGALSVGIGFGLQSIVNNFVSGLILLFERPIKVGDWIVTSSGEGIVKRISVRSTEIETFDRSSVIVPNSELISNSVTNWTHKDKIGRVIVPIGVSYDADPKEVIKLLEEVANEDPKVLSYPAPFVHFCDFGDNSLNFELRGFIRDINSALSVRTQLRVAIFDKLREAGIEIPFPQRDVHIKPDAYLQEQATPNDA